MFKEYQAGQTTFGPLQLKSIWEPHILRDFELRVIMQVAGCEDIVAQMLSGASVAPNDRAPLDLANYIAKQKGYQPLFVFSGREVAIADGGEEVLRRFFASDVWAGRNTKQTRRI
ncbi:hypothetical protein ACIPY2_08830 [Paenarthrobacter sp. NPDC089675]|uniref:hypothetical protein n=1 Tax=Paenarthrobacter sp. NPDC089675 TaxID=3364376 RepID=UPI00380CE7D7